MVTSAAYIVPGLIRRTCESNLIASVVCEYFNLTLLDLRGRNKRRGLVEARQIFLYFVYLMTNLDTKKTGALIARDHSSVSYSVSVVHKLISVDRGFKKRVEDIAALIQNQHHKQNVPIS